MMLENSLPNATVIEAGSISDLSMGSRESQGWQPNLILLDIVLPGLNGLAGLTLLRSRWPNVPVLVLTSHTEAEMRESAMLCGADGFLSKAESAQQMLQIIRGLLARSPDAPTPPVSADNRSSNLTPRQCEVLELLCLGLSNKVIGKRMGLSENTIRGHVQGLLAVLRVTSRAEAVIAARELGLVR